MHISGVSRRFLASMVALTIGFSVASPLFPASAAVNLPVVSWSSPVDGSTVSGRFTLVGLAAPDALGSATITKWCFTGDNGAPMAAGSNVGYSTRSGANYPDSDFYGNAVALALDANGCMTSSLDLRKVFLTFNTTGWPNGSHSWTAQVTDSNGRVSTIATTSVVSSNANPTVSWSSPVDGSTVSGRFTLVGLAAPDALGTATISKWCFTGDSGVPMAAGSNVGYSTRSGANYPDSDFYGNAVALALDANGCMTSSSDLRKVFLSFNSTAWVNGTHTWAAQVTDSNGRVSTTPSITAQLESPLPKLGTVKYSYIGGGASLGIDSTPSSDGGVKISNFTWAIDGGKIAGKGNKVDVSTLKPGTHNATVTANFSNGDSASSQLTFVSKPLVATAGKSSITLSCPNSVGKTFRCSVLVRSSKGVTGFVNVTPQYSNGGGRVVSLKKLKVKIGSKATVVFPYPNSNNTQDVFVRSSLVGGGIESDVTTYYPDVSVALDKLNSAGGSTWTKDKIAYLGSGYGPSVIYLSNDARNYCGVWVYKNSDEWKSDFDSGVIPWDNAPYWSFADKSSGFGVFVTTSDKNSACAKTVKRAFSLR